MFHKSPTIPDAPEEHRINLPGLDVAINHTTKTVFIVDQTGGADVALIALEEHFKKQGYFLHAVSVTPAPSPKEVG